MDKVVFGIENQNNFLEGDEVVGLLEHQVGRGGLLAQTSQFEDEVPGYYKEAYDEQPRTEDGETLDGSFHGEILHADQPHQENWQEQHVDQTKEVLLPESFPDEPLAPVFDSLVEEFLAEKKSCQDEYYRDDKDEVEVAHRPQEGKILQDWVDAAVHGFGVKPWGFELTAEEIRQEREQRVLEGTQGVHGGRGQDYI